MPFVPVNNAARFELRFTWDNQEVENTLWFTRGLGWPSSSILSFADALGDWWNTNLRPRQSNLLTMREIYGRDYETNPGAEATSTDFAGISGSRTAPAMPNNVTVAVSFRTGQSGRSFRGRNYFLGLCEDQVQNNGIASTESGLILAAYELLITLATTNGATWVVVSQFSGVDSTGAPIPRAAGVATAITAVTMPNLVVDSQRRRLPGRGR